MPQCPAFDIIKRMLKPMSTNKFHIIQPSVTKTERDKETSILLGVIFGIFGLGTGVFAALSANSMVIFSEILKNAGLTAAIFISWLCVRKVNIGKSEGYDYGHGKLENFSGLIIAVFLIISLVLILYQAFERLLHPVEMHMAGAEIGLVFSGIALICSISMWIYDRRLAGKEHSPVMESLWRLFRSKTISTSIVSLSLLLSIIFSSYEWSFYIDPVSSLVVCVFLAYSIYGISSTSVYDLLDHALEESLQFVILKELVSHFDEYEALHGIRTRRTAGRIYVEIFLEFDGESKMSDVQQVIGVIKTDLERKIAGSQVAIIPAKADVA